MIQNPIFWDVITLAIVVGFAGAFWRASRQPLWAEAFRRLSRNPMAMAALAVVAVYVSIGLLDSVDWKHKRNAEPRTIIDRVFARTKERTYSAPFARWTTGEPHPHPVRERHILGTDAVGNDVLYLTLKGCRTALIIA